MSAAGEIRHPDGAGEQRPHGAVRVPPNGVREPPARRGTERVVEPAEVGRAAATGHAVGGDDPLPDDDVPALARRATAVPCSTT